MQFLNKVKLKSYQKNIFYVFFVSFVYLISLNITGSIRLTDYQTTHFSLSILVENFFSPFVFFYDLLGPGTRLPLGSGLNFFFPTGIAIKNYFLFTCLTAILCFYLQLNFLKKIFNFFKFKNVYILSLFYSFNISVVYHLLNSDGLKILFTFSCLPIVFYYIIKFLNTKTEIYFYKLILVLSYVTLNSHEIYLLTCFLGFVFLIILNNKFFFLKKKYFYLGFALLILVNLENVYRIYLDLFNYPFSDRLIIQHYSPKHYLSGVAFFFKFFEDFSLFDFAFASRTKIWDNFYFPFSGILFYFSLYEAIKLIFKKKSKNIYYINIIFLSLIFLTFFNLDLFSFSAISASFILRGILNFFSIILFGNFLQSVQIKKLKTLILSISLLFVVLHFFSSSMINYKNKNEYSVLKKNKNYETSEAYNFFRQIYFKNTDYSKTYLSSNVWKMIFTNSQKKVLEGNIFNFTDLIYYKIYPFNAEFKTASKFPLRNSPEIFYSNIYPDLNEINDPFFFNIFNIHYLLIMESEKNKIDLKKFQTVSKLDIEKDTILILELIDKSKVTVNDYSKLMNAQCNREESVKCLLKNRSVFQKDKSLEIVRINSNEYQIINNSKIKKNLVLPLLYETSWKTKKSEIKNYKEGLMIVKIDSGTKDILFYRDSLGYNHT